MTKILRKYFIISQLSGEQLGLDCVFISQTDTKFMLLPKHLIFENNPPNSIFTRIVFKMDLDFPKMEQLLTEFKNGRLWKRNIEHLIKNRRDTRIKTGNNIHNVPISSRIGKVFPPKKYYNPTERDKLFIDGMIQGLLIIFV
jgi:hypothetical protein